MMTIQHNVLLSHQLLSLAGTTIDAALGNPLLTRVKMIHSHEDADVKRFSRIYLDQRTQPPNLHQESEHTLYRAIQVYTSVNKGYLSSKEHGDHNYVLGRTKRHLQRRHERNSPNGGSIANTRTPNDVGSTEDPGMQRELPEQKVFTSEQDANSNLLPSVTSATTVFFSNPTSPGSTKSINDSPNSFKEVDKPIFPFYIRVWASVALVLVLIVGVIGNALVPLLVCLNKDLRHSTNLFLLNLAAADLLVLLVCLPTAMVELHVRPDTWILGSVMCWLVPLIEVLVTRASVLTLVVISVERYQAICRPLRTSSVCSKPRAALTCATLWLLSLVSSIPTLQATKFLHTQYYDGTPASVCLTGLHQQWVTQYYLASAFIFVLTPFLLLLGVYSLIAARLLVQRPQASPRYMALQQWRAKKQVALMLGAVVVVFFVCLLPFQILTVWIILSPEDDIRSVSAETYYNILYACRLMLYINSAANPVIYNVMSSKFRKALLKLFGWQSSVLNPRSLRRWSTITTSLSSSSFVSLKRRASQVLSRTLSRKSDHRKHSSDQSACNGKDVDDMDPQSDQHEPMSETRRAKRTRATSDSSEGFSGSHHSEIERYSGRSRSGPGDDGGCDSTHHRTCRCSVYFHSYFIDDKDFDVDSCNEGDEQVQSTRATVEMKSIDKRDDDTNVRLLPDKISDTFESSRHSPADKVLSQFKSSLDESRRFIDKLVIPPETPHLPQDTVGNSCDSSNKATVVLIQNETRHKSSLSPRVHFSPKHHNFSNLSNNKQRSLSLDSPPTFHKKNFRKKVAFQDSVTGIGRRGSASDACPEP